MMLLAPGSPTTINTMPTTINFEAYKKLTAEDLEWLLKQPRSLERDRIEMILRRHIENRAHYDIEALRDGRLRRRGTG